jgi:uncharacterized membrane protein YedE/YeeE
MMPESNSKRVATIGALTILLAPTAVVAQEAAVHAEDYDGAAWSPYIVGALIGVLSMFTFYFSDKPLGASTAYAKVAGMLGRLLVPGRVKKLNFFQKKEPVIGWEVVLVAGIVLGSFLSAWSGGELTGKVVPAMWADRFGAESDGLRLLCALGGGILMALGARMAGGCTSGHGISGTLQLSVGSWVAAIFMFIGGIVTAFLLF